MSELRKYAGDALFYFPLIEDGDADFVTDYTPAAGDAKIFTDKLISTNPTALILGFDSLSEIPAQIYCPYLYTVVISTGEWIYHI